MGIAQQVTNGRAPLRVRTANFSPDLDLDDEDEDEDQEEAVDYTGIISIAERIIGHFSSLTEDEDYFRRLEYVGSNYKNQSGHSSKFWEIRWSGGTITTRWGKIGSKGQSKTQSGSKYKAMNMAGKKFDKGYVDKTPKAKKPAAKAKPAHSKKPKKMTLSQLAAR